MFTIFPLPEVLASHTSLDASLGQDTRRPQSLHLPNPKCVLISRHPLPRPSWNLAARSGEDGFDHGAREDVGADDDALEEVVPKGFQEGEGKRVGGGRWRDGLDGGGAEAVGREGRVARRAESAASAWPGITWRYQNQHG